MVSAEQIEESLEQLSVATGKFKLVEMGAQPGPLNIPGINWAVVSAGFEITGRTVYQKFLILGQVITKNVAKESERRKSLHPAVQYVVQRTLFDNIGLDMEPIRPLSWREITSEEDLGNGLMKVEIRLECKAFVPKLSPTETEQLLLGIDGSIMIKDGDDTADATDNINFEA